MRVISEKYNIETLQEIKIPKKKKLQTIKITKKMRLIGKKVENLSKNDEKWK